MAVKSKEFNPNEYMLNLKGKQYLPVAARLAWFRIDHPEWGIETEAVMRGKESIVMKATITNDGGRIIATARKREDKVSFSDYIEKAETGAIGRALGMCGYGTLQAPEFDEGDRLADTPQEKELEVIDGVPGKCAHCNAPAGKPHASDCPKNN